MKFIITKTVEAKNIKKALAMETKGEIVDIQKEEGEHKIGF